MVDIMVISMAAALTATACAVKENRNMAAGIRKSQPERMAENRMPSGETNRKGKNMYFNKSAGGTGIVLRGYRGMAVKGVQAANGDTGQGSG